MELIDTQDNASSSLSEQTWSNHSPTSDPAVDSSWVYLWGAYNTLTAEGYTHTSNMLIIQGSLNMTPTRRIDLGRLRAVVDFIFKRTKLDILSKLSM